MSDAIRVLNLAMKDKHYIKAKKMSKITEYLRGADLREIEGDEYARLLALAYDEGRLAAILRRAGLAKKVLIIVVSKTRRQ